jgi:hypothetical protein
MCGCQASHALATALPATIKEDPSFTRKTGQKIAPGQMHAHHCVGTGRVRHADMGDMVGGEDRTILGAYDPFVGVLADTGRFD